MKRILFLLLIVAGGAYYANQAGLVPGWEPVPLPQWVPDWARIAPHAASSDAAAGRGGGQRNGQGRSGQGRNGQGSGGDGAIPVVAAAARYEDVPVTADAVGTVQALNTVTVRAQVDGKLIELDFKDGQDVKKGDVLARIDPATYQAQYDQAVAKKAQDEATLANARNDLVRYQRLASTEAGSKQQADTQKALVAQLEAQVAGDQAAIDNTKATLAYTTIVAPIDGRTGIRLVDQGNILRSSDIAGIVVITQVKPITVLFNLPQQQLRAVNASMVKGPVAVNVLEADNTTVIDKGTIQVIDNQVDQTTGTIKFKALYPNANLQLWPGQFVNVRLYVDVLEHAVVVPTAAVQRGPNGAYVYVLGGNSKVALRNVVVGRQNETEAVITSGLQPPEQVITTGFARLTDGSEVRFAPPEAASGAAAPAGPAVASPAPASPAPASPALASPAQAGAAAAVVADPPAARAPDSGAQAGTPGRRPSGEGGAGRRQRGQRPPGEGQAASPAPAPSPGAPPGAPPSQ
ncbi:membrane fusion protein, multidrug efflux system [Rhizobiales bacterium GAS113]|jgi:multidrug efflux system membrane fusion protein|nr:membrane fusion protein, multidrug efflux system [Rhizobiales bacterium GAS113]